MNELLQGVSILPWFNPENRVKALKAAVEAEDHLWALKDHDYSSEITAAEKTRLHSQIVIVWELWNQDMQEWQRSESER